MVTAQEIIENDSLHDGQIQVSTVYLPDSDDYQTKVFFKESEVEGQTWRSQSAAAARQRHADAVSGWQGATLALCLDCKRNDGQDSAALIVRREAICMATCTAHPAEGFHQHSCSVCKPEKACDEHPNWCWDCSRDADCDLHREER